MVIIFVIIGFDHRPTKKRPEDVVTRLAEWLSAVRPGLVRPHTHLVSIAMSEPDTRQWSGAHLPGAGTHSIEADANEMKMETRKGSF